MFSFLTLTCLREKDRLLSVLLCGASQVFVIEREPLSDRTLPNALNWSGRGGLQ